MNEARRISILERVAISMRLNEKELLRVGHERLARICGAIAVRLMNKVDEYDEDFQEATRHTEPQSAEIIIFSPRKNDV